MAALGLVRAGDLLQEPGALPGVAGGQHGEGGSGQEPGEAELSTRLREISHL